MQFTCGHWQPLLLVKPNTRLVGMLNVSTKPKRCKNIVMYLGNHQLAKSALRYVTNCPVTKHDMKITIDISGPNLGSLQGKTVHCPNPHV